MYFPLVQAPDRLTVYPGCVDVVLVLVAPRRRVEVDPGRVRGQEVRAAVLALVGHPQRRRVLRLGRVVRGNQLQTERERDIVK